ncbi:hypothetical protein SSX86_003647 [Deinandra increscens subsp. villosa]|uniref:Uncharacterized protein n=1 Tax=Deinandra increscens subsp. villosa TaxID=3103831 RepID=A0AAP0DQE5_9ASTR
MAGDRDRNDYRWTNERHLNFLKSVEAFFVRTMLDNGDGRYLLTDRHVPDCCESTLDSAVAVGRKRKKKHFPADDNDASLVTDRRVTRFRLQSSHFPQDDQVVPRVKQVQNDDDEKN